MFSALILAGICLLGILVALIVASNPEKVEAVQRRLSPAEEARYEMHPTLTPDTVEITAENVRDVIADTIESGTLHPALAARRAQA